MSRLGSYADFTFTFTCQKTAIFTVNRQIKQFSVDCQVVLRSFISHYLSGSTQTSVSQRIFNVCKLVSMLSEKKLVLWSSPVTLSKTDITMLYSYRTLILPVITWLVPVHHFQLFSNYLSRFE